MRNIGFGLIAFLTGCVAYEGHEEQIFFESQDGVILQGSLVFPDTHLEVVPAIVLLHGAEAATRSLVYRMQANVFLDRGFAVLLYDKRGAGSSGGVHRASFAHLVNDALAAITFLETRAEIDPSLIGIMSASESGWITPEVVHRSGNVAFAINKVGPVVSWRETVAWENYNDLLAAGRTEQEARREVDLMERIWSYYVAPDNETRVGLEQEIAAWRRHADTVIPLTLRDPTDDFLHQLRYEPDRFLKGLSIPMLYLYGSEDINVPTLACVARLKELQAAGKPLSFRVFDGAGHELGSPWIAPPFYRFERGYAELIGDFAQSHFR